MVAAAAAMVMVVELDGGISDEDAGGCRRAANEGGGELWR